MIIRLAMLPKFTTGMVWLGRKCENAVHGQACISVVNMFIVSVTMYA